jgi:hydrogenase maturation protein HypF
MRRSVQSLDPRVTVLALGARTKATVTLAHGGALVSSRYLGDLETAAARDLLAAAVEDMCAGSGARPGVIACDLHPDYATTRFGEELCERWRVPLVRVQHQQAHVAACMAEHELDGEVLALAWDGAGYGLDGAVWGGEAFIGRGHELRRCARIRPFRLPGADRAGREPRRAALGLLFALAPEEVEACARPWFGADLALHVLAIERRVHAPACTSIGRMFDAAAALLGLCEQGARAGEAARALEARAATVEADGAYPLPLMAGEDGLLVGDTRPVVRALLEELRAGVDVARIARRFHEAFIDYGVAVAERKGVDKVVLAGGCFQNRLLADGLERRLERAGHDVLTARELPSDDAGISIGQAWLAACAAGVA